MPVNSYEVVDCTINPVQNYYLSVIFVIGIVQLNSGVNEKEAIPLLAWKAGIFRWAGNPKTREIRQL